MMDNKIIIDGEASETDSDEDTHFHSNDTPSKMAKSVKGAIIVGEASESEDEHGSSISSAVSALTQPHKTPEILNEQTEEKFNSLLHKKLKERNRLLHENLQTLTHNVINEATRDLTSIDQHLLKSQVTLQAAVTSLRSLNQNASALKDKLDAIMSSNFLENVRVPNN